MKIKHLIKRILKLYKLEEVFTPNTAAKVTYVHRISLEQQLDKDLLQPGRAIIIYGHSGSGKTTLILNRLRHNKINFIKISCDHDTTYEQILLSAIDELDIFYVQQKSTYRKYSISQKLGAEFKSFKADNEKSQTVTFGQTSTRLVNPQINAQKLAKFLGEVHAVLLLEDFHKVCEGEKQKIADLVKIFIDAANDYPQLKIICIGAVDTPRELIQQGADLYPRLSEVAVPLLSDDEVQEIIKKGTKVLNVIMDRALVDKIKFYSNNIASLAHKMCFDICYQEDILKASFKKKRIDDSKFRVAVQSFIDSNSDSFKRVYDLSTKDSLGWYILKTISSFSKPMDTNSIIKRVNNKQHSFNKSDIESKLNSFVSDEFKILRYDGNSCKYSVSTPFWGAFLKMKLAMEKAEKEKNNKNRKNPNLRIKNVDEPGNDILMLFLNEIQRQQELTK